MVTKSSVLPLQRMEKFVNFFFFMNSLVKVTNLILTNANACDNNYFNIMCHNRMEYREKYSQVATPV